MAPTKILLGVLFTAAALVGCHRDSDDRPVNPPPPVTPKPTPTAQLPTHSMFCIEPMAQQDS
jgi:hypothetical protein